MELKKYRLKLYKDADSEKGSFQRYSLSYSPCGERPAHAAYDIISSFVAGYDVIMDLDSDLFPNSRVKGRNCLEKFLSDIRSLGLTHSYKKVPSDRRVTFLGFAMDRKKVEPAEKIAVYVPNGVWKAESFKVCTPACGARYYIVNEGMDADAAVNGIWDMSEDEKAAAFLLNAFTVSEFGQMGIVSVTLGEKGIRSILGIA